METVRGPGGFLRRLGGLTKMYVDMKNSYENITKTTMRDDPEMLGLQRKFRIQKDRFVTWGLEWSSDTSSESGEIDSSLDQAGLSELAGSIMTSIKEIIDEAERLQCRDALALPEKGPNPGPASVRWNQEDHARAEDLLKDLTASIDTLYDLSRSRRMLTSEAPVQSPEESLHARDETLWQHSPYSKPASSFSSIPSHPPPYEGTKGKASYRDSQHNIVPSSAEDITLLEILQRNAKEDSSHVPPLEDRFCLGFELAVSLHVLRDDRRIRAFDSSRIVLRPDSTGTYDTKHEGHKSHYIREPAITQLSSYDYSTPTRPTPLDIYRHPLDDRDAPCFLKKAFDIYSLGLILLEIGLWMPLESFWKMKYTNAMFKSRIQEIYVKKLSSRCGTEYMRAAQCCLVMADDTFKTMSISKSTSLSSTPGEIHNLNKRFYDEVLRRLQKCCSLDEAKQLPPVDPVTPPKEPKQFTEKPQASEVPLTRQDQDVKPRSKRCTIWPRCRLPPRAKEEWNKVLMRRLSRLLDRVYSMLPDAASGSAGPFMIGESPNAAKPTIVVECSCNCEEIRRVLEHYLKLNRDVWDLLVVKGKVGLTMASKKKKKTHKGREAAKVVNTEAAAVPNLNPAYVERPSCGASIGAYVNGVHHPPVSFGGTLLVDGEPLAMTVHHMLDDPLPESDTDECEAESSCNGSESCSSSFGQGDFGLGASPENGISLELPDDYATSICNTDDRSDSGQGRQLDLSGSLFADLDFSDDEDAAYQSDDDSSTGGPGVFSNGDQAFYVTQPALDDVLDGFFPDEELRDEDHLYSHLLGTILASSGVRQCKREGMKHEVDWALIKVNENRLSLTNAVVGGRKYCCVDNYPKGMSSLEDLDALEVHCLGRSSGLQEGFLMGTRLIKMPGRPFSTSWCISGDFGEPGDSGAWIFDNDTGNICGHVLGWSATTTLAYMTPMQILVDDIAQTLGARNICLPGKPEHVLVGSTGSLQSTFSSDSPSGGAMAPKDRELMYDLSQGFKNVQLRQMAEGKGCEALRAHVPSLA